MQWTEPWAVDAGVVLLPGPFLLFYSSEVAHVPKQQCNKCVTQVSLKGGKGERRTLFSFYVHLLNVEFFFLILT